MYPNPADGWIRIGGYEALNSYSICDATGREVRKGNHLSAREAIRLDGLARGFYLLHTTQKDGKESTYKFTIK
ncbi:MAG: T9SS type A sorting domain-containing protein [Bacteroidetes bacterium]|nr:T9SS type A sorting domain-containing protein [Bacteroidota bacterium]